MTYIEASIGIAIYLSVIFVMAALITAALERVCPPTKHPKIRRYSLYRPPTRRFHKV